jgi:hypothetical protein
MSGKVHVCTFADGENDMSEIKELARKFAAADHESDATAITSTNQNAINKADGAAESALDELLTAEAESEEDWLIQVEVVRKTEELWPGMILHEKPDSLMHLIESMVALIRQRMYKKR